MKWQRLSNAPVVALLKSPLHRLISGSILLITVTGVKSHRQFSTPVNYVRDPESDDLFVVSLKDRSWWRNLRGGAHVEIVLKGKRIPAFGEALEARDDVETALLTVLRQSASYRKHAGITLNASRNPVDHPAFERFARSKVIVRLSTADDPSIRPAARIDKTPEEAAPDREVLIR